MDHHAQDISNAPIQDAIATSLLGPELEQDLPEETPEDDSIFQDSVELLNAAVDEQSNDAVKYGDGLLARRYNPAVNELENSEQEPREQDANAEPQEQTQSQAHPEQIADPSPQQVKEVLQTLDSFADRFQLNEDSRKFADDMAPLLGPEIYRNEALLSNTVSRYTLSACNEVMRSNGDLSKFPPLSPPMIQEASRAVALLFDVNPQENPLHDPALTANAMRYGLANLIATHLRTGETDVTRLNDRDTAVWFLQNIVKGIWGVTEPVNPKFAVQFANKVASRVISMLPKINEGISASRSNRSSRGRSQTRAPRVAGGAKNIGRTEFAPRFKTNNDIFTPGVLDAAITRNL